MRHLLIALLPALAVAACGDAAGAGMSVASIDTIDGIERLTYAADPAGELGWTLDTVAAVGDALAEDAYQFDQITDERLAGDADGAFYVLDGQGKRVLKYDRTGAHIATYGRSGEGPGELSQPLGMTLGPGDTIWVTDFSNGRLTGYPQGGGDARTVPYTEDQGVPSPVLAALEDGGFIQSFRPMFNFRGGPGGLQRETGSEGERPRIPLVRLTGDARPVDTLWAVPEPPNDMVTLEMDQRVMIMMMTREFWPDLQWRPFSDGTVVVSDTADYFLRFVRPDGTVERVIARHPAARLATEEDREYIRERERERSAAESGGIRIGGGGGPDEATRQKMLEERLSKMTFADRIPRIVDLRVDAMDRLWVAVSEEVPDSIARIDVYDRAGQLLGELRDFPLPDVFSGTDGIGLLQRDDLDVQQLLITRLVQPERVAGR